MISQGDLSITGEYLYDYIKKLPDLSVLDKAQIIEEEVFIYEEYILYNTTPHLLMCYNHLLGFYTHQNYPIHRARILIAKSKAVRATDIAMATSHIQEAISLLKGENTADQKLSPKYKFLLDLLASAYAWRGILERESPSVTTEKPSDQNWLDYLSKALLYWKLHFDQITPHDPSVSQNPLQYFNNIKNTHQDLEQLIDLFNWAQEYEKQIASLQLLLKLKELGAPSPNKKNNSDAKEGDTQEYITLIKGRIAVVYNQLGYDGIALNHFREALSLKKEVLLKINNGIMEEIDLDWLMITSVLSSEKGKLPSIETIEDLYKSLLNNYLSNQSHTHQERLQVAKFNYLLSTLYERQGNLGLALKASLECLYYLTSMIPKSGMNKIYKIREKVPKDLINYNPQFTKWGLLSYFVSTLSKIGEIYRLFGIVRQSHFYFERGLIIGELLNIPKIEALFHLKLFQLHHKSPSSENGLTYFHSIDPLKPVLSRRVLVESNEILADYYLKMKNLETARENYKEARGYLEEITNKQYIDKVVDLDRILAVEWTPKEKKIISVLSGRKEQSNLRKNYSAEEVCKALMRLQTRLLLKVTELEILEGNLTVAEDMLSTALSKLHLTNQDTSKHPQGSLNEYQDWIILFYNLARISLLKYEKSHSIDETDPILERDLKVLWENPNSSKVDEIERSKKYLSQALKYCELSGWPALLTTEVCQLLALLTGASDIPYTTSLINASVGISFFHYNMSLLEKRICHLEKSLLEKPSQSKGKPATKSDPTDQPTDLLSSLTEQFDQLSLSSSVPVPQPTEESTDHIDSTYLLTEHSHRRQIYLQNYQNLLLNHSLFSKQLMASLPPTWTICTLAITSDLKHLLISRYQANPSFHSRTPISLRLPLISISKSTRARSKQIVITQINQFEALKSQYNTLIKQATTHLTSQKEKKKDTQEWWDTRYKFDNQLSKILLEMEEKIWDEWKGILMGSFKKEKLQQKMERQLEQVKKYLQKLKMDIPEEKNELLRICFFSCGLLKDKQCIKCLRKLFMWEDRNHKNDEKRRGILKEVLLEIRKVYFKILILYGDIPESESPLDIESLSPEQIETFSLEYTQYQSRNPVILIVDKHLHDFPIESLPCLKACPVTRMPSIVFVKSRLDLYFSSTSKPSIHRDGISLCRTYYVINPDGNLDSTQQTLLPLFKQYGLKKGLSGQYSSEKLLDAFKTALSQYHLFIYCGHNSGEQYITREEIEKINKCAVALLMGCSSVLLESNGEYEPSGAALAYLIAESPAMVGNLWVVTGKDLDKVTCSLLSQWFKSNDSCSLLDCVPKAREKCKLEYINGAALIHYGLPVYFTQQ